MFLITYTKEFKRVKIDGFNPDNPSDPFSDVITFGTEKDAEGFCLIVRAIEAAVESVYDGKFAVKLTVGDTVEITTETSLTKSQEEKLGLASSRLLIWGYTRFCNT